MTTINLNDTSARISKIEISEAGTMVSLEWGGPNDRTLQEFDLHRIGRVSKAGQSGSTGWVLLDGDCALREGDVIPLDAASVEP
jgi:hypothetical protein